MRTVVRTYPNGDLSYVGEKPAILDGISAICEYRQRVGFIEPLPIAKRAVFRILRALFGDSGAVAAWTRRWSGPWLLRVPRYGHVSVHSHRWVAVEVEREIVNR